MIGVESAPPSAPRILFFLPRLAAYRDRVRLLAEIANEVEAFVLLVGRMDDDVRSSNVEVVSANFRDGHRVPNMLAARRLAKRLVHERRLSIVHDTFSTLLPSPPRFPSVTGSRPHRPVTLESVYGPEEWRLKHLWGGEPAHRLLRHPETAMMYYNARAQRLAIRSADHLVVQAPGLIPYFFPPGRPHRNAVHVLTNNVDTEFWAPRERQPEGATTPLRLLFAGNVDRHRGIFALLSALSSLAAQGVDAELTVHGRWNPLDRPAGEEYVRSQRLDGRVKLLDPLPREELREAFRSHDIFVYQSVNDGSPRVVLEAASTAIPIIASGHPGIRVLDPSGDFIHYTDYSEVDKIVHLVRQFAENAPAWRRRAQDGRSEIVRRFRTEVVAHQYVGLYRRILGENRVRLGWTES